MAHTEDDGARNGPTRTLLLTHYTPRTIEMAIPYEAFVKDTPPMVVIRGICEHGIRWAKGYYADGMRTDWDALDALKEMTPAPSCEQHR